MTDYGICAQYVGTGRTFKYPPPCPECNKEAYKDKDYPCYSKNYIHDITYVSDYVTHRVGYHDKSPDTVYWDLCVILDRENKDSCCTPCSDYDCNCHNRCEHKHRTENCKKKFKEYFHVNYRDYPCNFVTSGYVVPCPPELDHQKVIEQYKKEQRRERIDEGLKKIDKIESRIERVENTEVQILDYIGKIKRQIELIEERS